MTTQVKQRMARQGLADPPARTVAAAALTCGLQAQDAAAVRLGGGPLTRQQIVGAGEAGVVVDPAGQAPVHVLVYLASIGLTCHADGDRFALTDQWLPGTPEGPRADDALAAGARPRPIFNASTRDFGRTVPGRVLTG